MSQAVVDFKNVRIMECFLVLFAHKQIIKQIKKALRHSCVAISNTKIKKLSFLKLAKIKTEGFDPGSD